MRVLDIRTHAHPLTEVRSRLAAPAASVENVAPGDPQALNDDSMVIMPNVMCIALNSMSPRCLLTFVA